MQRKFNYTFGAIIIVAAILILRGTMKKDADIPEDMPTRKWLCMSTFASFSVTERSRLDEGAAIVREAFDEVAATLSVFNTDSALFMLNKTGSYDFPIIEKKEEINPLYVISQAVETARRTGGAFDPTVGPLMRLWGFRKTTREATMPSVKDIGKVLSKTGYDKVLITTNDNKTATVSFAVGGVELDLGGIAKGYAVDLAYTRLQRAGFNDYMINLGGNIRVNGRPNATRDWLIAVYNPDEPSETGDRIVVLKSGEAVATSGSYERYVVIDGKQYSHIIDPRTGYPVRRSDSATIIAETAIEADAMSTATFVGFP